MEIEVNHHQITEDMEMQGSSIRVSIGLWKLRTNDTEHTGRYGNRTFGNSGQPFLNNERYGNNNGGYGNNGQSGPNYTGSYGNGAFGSGQTFLTTQDMEILAIQSSNQQWYSQLKPNNTSSGYGNGGFNAGGGYGNSGPFNQNTQRWNSTGQYGAGQFHPNTNGQYGNENHSFGQNGGYQGNKGRLYPNLNPGY
ncbi:hypothetical protein JTB14_028452 [Gonioctena quinquepunctata]|nr:hypothetical protein JTB14_028452 [Gonioctena quinquepunctata]